MTEDRKPRKEQKPKNVLFYTGRLACQRCTSTMSVVDLNPERKVVKCPVCSFPNDIREAIKRAL
jgi:hypothetical protein